MASRKSTTETEPPSGALRLVEETNGLGEKRYHIQRYSYSSGWRDELTTANPIMASILFDERQKQADAEEWEITRVVAGYDES